MQSTLVEPELLGPGILYFRVTSSGFAENDELVAVETSINVAISCGSCSIGSPHNWGLTVFHCDFVNTLCTGD